MSSFKQAQKYAEFSTKIFTGADGHTFVKKTTRNWQTDEELTRNLC